MINLFLLKNNNLEFHLSNTFNDFHTLENVYKSMKQL